jgi:hypothetical protein
MKETKTFFPGRHQRQPRDSLRMDSMCCSTVISMTSKSPTLCLEETRSSVSTADVGIAHQYLRHSYDCECCRASLESGSSETVDWQLSREDGNDACPMSAWHITRDVCRCGGGVSRSELWTYHPSATVSGVGGWSETAIPCHPSSYHSMWMRTYVTSVFHSVRSALKEGCCCYYSLRDDINVLLILWFCSKSSEICTDLWKLATERMWMRPDPRQSKEIFNSDQKKLIHSFIMTNWWGNGGQLWSRFKSPFQMNESDSNTFLRLRW